MNEGSGTAGGGRLGRIVWLAAYGVAMGVLEAVVVVYLREILYPAGFRFPIVPMAARLALAEIVREAMTLVMLLAVAALSERRGLDRFYAFGFLFGVWDLVYYASLQVSLGWPASFLEWDLLFLIPVPWLSPVLYPVIVSVLLIAGFGVHEGLRLGGGRLDPGRTGWLVATAGALTVIVSFCWRFRDVLEARVPESFPAPLFAAGLALAAAPFVRAALWQRPSGA